MSDQTAPLTGAQHFAKAAEILAECDTIVKDSVRVELLQRAAIHAQLAQASATAASLSGVYSGVFGIPENRYYARGVQSL